MCLSPWFRRPANRYSGGPVLQVYKMPNLVAMKVRSAVLLVSIAVILSLALVMLGGQRQPNSSKQNAPSYGPVQEGAKSRAEDSFVVGARETPGTGVYLAWLSSSEFDGDLEGMQVELDPAVGVIVEDVIVADAVEGPALFAGSTSDLPKVLAFRHGAIGAQDFLYPEWDFTPGPEAELDLVPCVGRPCRIVLVDSSTGKELRGLATISTYCLDPEAQAPHASYSERPWGELESPFCVDRGGAGSAWLRVALPGYDVETVALPRVGSGDELELGLSQTVEGVLLLSAATRLLGCTVALEFPDREASRRLFSLREDHWRRTGTGRWTARLSYHGPGSEAVRVVLDPTISSGDSLVLGEVVVPKANGFEIEVFAPTAVGTPRAARLWIQLTTDESGREALGQRFAGRIEASNPSAILAGQPGAHEFEFAWPDEGGMATAVLPYGIVPGPSRIKIDEIGYCMDLDLTEGDNYLPDVKPLAVQFLPSHELAASDRTLAFTASLQGCDQGGARGLRANAGGEYHALVVEGDLDYRRIGTGSLAAGKLWIRPDEVYYEFGARPELRFAIELMQGNDSAARPSTFWSGLRVWDSQGAKVERSMMPLGYHRGLDLAHEAWIGVPAAGNYTFAIEVGGQVQGAGGIEVRPAEIESGKPEVMQRVRLTLSP